MDVLDDAPCGEDDVPCEELKRMFGVEKKILRVAFRVEKDASPTANGRTDSC